MHEPTLNLSTSEEIKSVSSSQKPTVRERTAQEELASSTSLQIDFLIRIVQNENFKALEGAEAISESL
jgi:hypothetical protein